MSIPVIRCFIVGRCVLLLEQNQRCFVILECFTHLVIIAKSSMKHLSTVTEHFWRLILWNVVEGRNNPLIRNFSLTISQLWLQNTWILINSGKELGILSNVLQLSSDTSTVSSQQYQTSAKFSFPAGSFRFFPSLTQSQYLMLSLVRGDSCRH